MNKKGFTLIELIITIGIMVMIGLVIVTNMTGLFSKNEDVDYENFKKKIEDAACIYSERAEWRTKRDSCKQGTSTDCTITTDMLIAGGLIEESLKDPRKGQYVKNNAEYNVKISWVDGEKQCKMQ